MIVKLMNDFKQSDEAMEEWMFAHANDHREILQAIQTQKGVQLVDYVLEPFVEKDLPAWLIRHQSMHNAMNGYLFLQGQDLNQVNLSDDQKRKEWIAQNFEEHYAARAALNI